MDQRLRTVPEPRRGDRNPTRDLRHADIRSSRCTAARDMTVQPCRVTVHARARPNQKRSYDRTNGGAEPAGTSTKSGSVFNTCSAPAGAYTASRTIGSQPVLTVEWNAPFGTQIA